MQQNPIVVVKALRTPMGKFLGDLKSFSSHELGSAVLRAIIEQTKIDVNKIDEVIMGSVLQAGQGQAPARQASLGAGLPVSIPCSTLNKVCGSGMKAVMNAHDAILVGSGEIILAGGMESMTNAPYLLLKARSGYRVGTQEMYDHMMLDGLEDAYDKHKPMGYFAELCASENQISRKTQDDFAITSFERAKAANEMGLFTDEIVPLFINGKSGETNRIDKDEHPFAVKFERIPHLKPAFQAEGTVTAGNSSSIADGAAALLVMRESTANSLNLEPLARIIAHTTHAKKPSLFPIAPIDAISQLLKKINWHIDDVDLFEINEAFAVVTLVAMQALNIPHEKINVRGGGCALGHPIGASGARIIVTLLHALQQLGKKRGIASLCIGGGEATAIAFEMI